jgi:MoxR-like ATPase
LPEAQKDRFMLKVKMDCPDRTEELLLAQRTLGQESPEATLARGLVQQVISADVLASVRQTLENMVVREELLAYVVDIVRSTRQHESVLVGQARAPRRPCCWPVARERP